MRRICLNTCGDQKTKTWTIYVKMYWTGGLSQNIHAFKQKDKTELLVCENRPTKMDSCLICIYECT